ncbi:MAG TPA: MDR family MFS transporter [Solirubrobacteraceae bacterium]
MAVTSPQSRRAVLVAFSGMMLATLLAALDQTIVATALPRIASDLHGFADLPWVVTAYLVSSTVTVPLYGKFSDLYGRRRLFVVSISIFVGGSALCAVAGSVGQLVVFRALQGVGAGGLLPLSQAAIADLFSPRERGRYQGYIGAMWATAAIAGPLLGGTLTDHATWRWIFLINLPLGALALVAVVRTMPVAFQARRHEIDYAGAVTLTIAVTSVLLMTAWGGVTYAWDSPQVLAAAAIGAIGLVAFLGIERRAREPLLPLALFRQPIFAVTSSGAFIIGALLFGVTIYTPVFVQGVLGQSATHSGVVLIPLSLGWVASAFVSGQLVARTGRYRVFPILGTALVLCGMLTLTHVGTGTSGLTVAAALVLTGLGMGVTWPVYVVATQNAVDPSQLGVATATLQFFRTMGGSLAVAALGALLTNRLAAELPAHVGRAAAERVDTNQLIQGGAHVAPSLRGGIEAALDAALDPVFLALVPLAAAGIALALGLKERPLRRSRPSVEVRNQLQVTRNDGV